MHTPAAPAPVVHAPPLAGQGAIVTGGARGIGLGIARRLAEEGCRVALWDVDFGSLDASAAGFVPVHKETVDVGNLPAVERAFAASHAALGGLDILINNAGINGPVAPSWEYPVAAWDRVLAVDLTGVFYCCRAAVPSMRARGYGRIVNVASSAGLVGYAYVSAYCASKHALVGYTRAAALELAGSGVAISAVCPHYVDTPMTERSAARIAEKTGRTSEAARALLASQNPLGRLVTPAEVAEAVFEQLAGDRNGAIAEVDGRGEPAGRG